MCAKIRRGERKSAHLAVESVDEELEGDGVDALDALLDDVVPVLVLDALEDVAVELLDQLALQLAGDRLQRLLNPAGKRTKVPTVKSCSQSTWLRTRHDLKYGQPASYFALHETLHKVQNF